MVFHKRLRFGSIERYLLRKTWKKKRRDFVTCYLHNLHFNFELKAG